MIRKGNEPSFKFRKKIQIREDILCIARTLEEVKLNETLAQEPTSVI